MQEYRLAPLETEQAREIYETYMKVDFPPSELKPFWSIEKMHRAGRCEMLGLYRGEVLAGYAFLLLEQDLPAILLDYLAVLPSFRGTGVGRCGLALLKEHYRGRYDAVCIESEYPPEAPDPRTAEKRLDFYRGGGCRDTAVEERAFGVRYKVFALDCGSVLPDSRLEECLQSIYERMLPPEVMARYVRFGPAAADPMEMCDWRAGEAPQ